MSTNQDPIHTAEWRCVKCRQIPWDAKDWPQNRFKVAKFEHHGSFSALEESAAAGCYLCRLFRAEFYTRSGTSTPEGGCRVETGMDWALQFFVGSDTLGTKRLERSDFHMDLIDEMRAKRRVIMTPNRLSEETMDTDLEWLVRERIQPWLQSCLAGTGLHTKCRHRKQRDDQNFELPTRLIEVGDKASNTVRLIESDNISCKQEQTPYLALSYVWGQGNEPAKTTRANISERLRRIGIDILPKTIQDAIKLARFMKVEYLWVDAVCIIQPCPEDNYLDDWKLEAPKMGSYYSSAYCLVSALSAADSSEGLFTERQVATYPIKSCTVAFDQHEEEYRYLPTLKVTHQSEFPGSPLMKRGWCLQEQLLSCRMLHWSKHCLFWECPGLFRRSELMAPIPRHVSIPEGIKVPDIFEQLSAEVALGELWLNVVSQYSSMRLTYGSDRLVAIHGLACRLLTAHRGRYFAGMFLSHIAQGLSWTAQLWGRKKVPDFPSWSWASAESNYGLGFHHLDKSLVRCISTEAFSNKPQATDFTQQINRILRLEAPLVWMELAAMPACGPNWYRSKRWDLRIQVDLDTQESEPSSMNRVCLLVLGAAVKKSYHLTALILQPSGRFYKRIGLAFIDVRTNEWMHIFSSEQLTPEINQVIGEFNDARHEVELI